MKFHLLTLLTLLFFTSCSTRLSDVYLFSYFKGNGEDGLHLAASKNGYNWSELKNGRSFLKPNVGEDKLMRDPCIIKGGDGKFHMVWTVSWKEKGIGYANSADLIHWSEQKYIPVMHHEPEARNCWAPEMFYDKESKIYYIYWATTIPGRYPETDSFGDDGYNHRMYYTTTKDFETFSKAKVLYDKGFNVIDATIVNEKDQYIMFLKNETLLPNPEKNIRIATSKQIETGYSQESAPISPHWVEGPTATKVGDKWVVYFDMYRKHQMGAIASYDLKSWTDISEYINFPAGTRHGTVFKIKKKILKELMELK